MTYKIENWGINLEEKWPEPGLVIAFKTPEDAQKMAKVLNNILGELEGQWAHIRNLEEKLLAPAEIKRPIHDVLNELYPESY